MKYFKESCSKQEVIKAIKEYKNKIDEIKKSIETEKNLININNPAHVKHFENYKNKRLKAIQEYKTLINKNIKFNNLNNELV